MKVNYRLKRLIFEVVDNQMALPETAFVKDKYEELLPKYGAKRAKEMIGAVLLREIYDMEVGNRYYDKIRYERLISELE
ncbi:MAG: hypothetical protein Q4C01_06880 [Clostridia bacterium]|nr:hypothetical protein [Clostridia bacterium]